MSTVLAGAIRKQSTRGDTFDKCINILNKQCQKSSYVTQFLMWMIICAKYVKNLFITMGTRSRKDKICQLLAVLLLDDLEDINPGQNSLHATRLLVICSWSLVPNMERFYPDHQNLSVPNIWETTLSIILYATAQTFWYFMKNMTQILWSSS